MKIGILIQARMNSSRLPEKVMYKVGGKPMLLYLIESMRQCSGLDEVAVATSVESSDDAIMEFCIKRDIVWFRGSLNDVAQRLLKAADWLKLDAFVRVSGDSPLLDYRLIDHAVEIFKSDKLDLVTNILKRSYPKGQSVEVLDASTYHRAYSLMSTGREKEHVTLHYYNNLDRYSVQNFESGEDFGRIQLSVDTPEDAQRFESVVQSFEKPHWEYRFRDILEKYSLLES